jgi:hypothetical protein
MASSSEYHRRVRQPQERIAGYQKEKGKLAKKVAELQKKIGTASQAASRARSESTLRSKQRDIERRSKELATTEGKIATVEGKIASEQKKLSAAQQSLAKEEQRLAKKSQHEREKQMREVTGKLTEHASLHKQTISAIEKLSQLPEKIVVLFLASNPLDQEQLRLDEEVRAIQEMIRKAEHRDSVSLVSVWAVQPMDVMQAINEHKPHIVHFSGHGSEHDEIVFQDDAGNTKLVSKDAIVQVMKACSGDIRLVFFNTCYSRNQAEAVVAHVEAAVGMNTSIGDEAARVFASQFYSAIGFGKSVQAAFEQGKALLMMEGISEEDTPELVVGDGIDADELIIVRPPEESEQESVK